MTYSTPVTAVAGASLPAASWNAGVRDNLTTLGSAWTSYTPTWGSTGTAPALGNGSVAGRYRLFGKTLDVRVLLTMGTTTTYGTAAWTISLPSGLSAAGKSVIPALFELASIYHGSAYAISGGSVFFPVVDNGAAGGVMTFPTGAIPAAWATGHTLLVAGTIEVN